MNKILIYVVIISIIMILFFGILIAMPIPTSEKGNDLIVLERDGWMIINTNPEQPMALNPYQQPRLSIDMRWRIEDKENVQIKLTFLYMGKHPVCPELYVFAGGRWQRLGDVEYRQQTTKGGIYHQVIVKTDLINFKQLCYLKHPIKVKVCDIEFSLHKVEYGNLRQVMEIWNYQ